MSQGLYIGLGVSIGVALFIMVAAFIITRKKINKIKDEYSINNIGKGEIREGAGDLLWDERDKTKNPLDDFQMDFLVNTYVKNGYKSYLFIQKGKVYETKSMKQLAKAKEATAKADYVVNFVIDKAADTFKTDFEKVNKNGMLIYLNAPKKERATKRLISDLKLIGVRYEHHKIGLGVILIVK